MHPISTQKTCIHASNHRLRLQELNSNALQQPRWTKPMCLLLLSIALQIQACLHTPTNMFRLPGKPKQTIDSMHPTLLRLPSCPEMTKQMKCCPYLRQQKQSILAKPFQDIDFYATDFSGKTILHEAARCPVFDPFEALLNKACLQRNAVGGDRAKGEIRALLMKPMYGSDNKAHYYVVMAPVATAVARRSQESKKQAREKFLFILDLVRPYLTKTDYAMIKAKFSQLKQQGSIKQKDYNDLCQIVDQELTLVHGPVEAKSITHNSSTGPVY